MPLLFVVIVVVVVVVDVRWSLLGAVGCGTWDVGYDEAELSVVVVTLYVVVVVSERNEGTKEG